MRNEHHRLSSTESVTVDELIEAQQVAIDEDSRVLVWTGGTVRTPMPAGPP